jgi:hypothetical protein
VSKHLTFLPICCDQMSEPHPTPPPHPVDAKTPDPPPPPLVPSPPSEPPPPPPREAIPPASSSIRGPPPPLRYRDAEPPARRYSRSQSSRKTANAVRRISAVAAGATVSEDTVGAESDYDEDGDDIDEEEAVQLVAPTVPPSRRQTSHAKKISNFWKRCCGVNCCCCMCRITEWRACCCFMFFTIVIVLLALVIRTYTHPVAAWKIEADTSGYQCVQRFNDTCLPWSNVTNSITVFIGFDWWWLRV